MKIKFKAKQDMPYCTPVGVNEEGHVIYKVDMDHGYYSTHVDTKDEYYEVEIVNG